MTEEEQKKIFANNLNHYINASGKQQKEVARELGFAQTTFNTWYVGKIMPRSGKIQAIADYFGILKSDLTEQKKYDDLGGEFMDVCVKINLSDERFQKIVIDYYDLSKEKKEAFCSFYEKFILRD